MPINSDYELMKIRLEQAAKIVVSSSVSKDERQASENLFSELRLSKSPYDFCKYTLETSKEPYLLFQAVCTLKEAIIREWSIITNDFVTDLENYLMNYVITTNSILDKFVQKAILQAIAVFYKRRILACKPNEAHKQLVQITIELFKTNDKLELRLICIHLLNALLNEFSNTNRSSNVGLTVNSHTNAKTLFEKKEMKILLVFVFEYLQHLLETNFNQVNKDFLLNFLSLIETCFTWEFTTSSNILKSFIRRVDSTTPTSFKPSPEYKQIFLNTNLITLLFKSYRVLKTDSELGHVCMQSIIQMSTLSGPIFHDDSEAKQNHLKFYIQNFIDCFSSSQIQEYELVNYSAIMENLLLTYSIDDYAELNADLVECFFQLISQFIMNCFNAEKLYDHETKKYFESYEKILSAWTRFKELNDGQLFKKYAQIVLDSFIQSRLQTNEQINGSLFNRSNCDNDSIDDEIEDDDLTRYNDVLFAISEFGRCIPEYCLGLLARILNEKFTNLTQYLTKISTTIDPNQTIVLNNLYEDIHWLLLISGFILFDMDSDLECQIPNEIMSYSISISSHVDSSALLRAYSNIDPSNSLNFINIDPICSLIYNALQLSELEIQMHSSKMLRNASPQVASTLMWFLNEFSRSYLFMNEKKYEQLSPILQIIYGQDTECAILLSNYLLRKIYSNFYIWSSETSVTLQTAKLFYSLVKNSDRCRYLFTNDLFWSISKICIDNSMPWILLQSNVKKLIIKSLIASLSNHKNNDDNLQLNFFNTIINPLSQRFDLLFSKKDAHVESVIKEVMSLIETFNGIIEGTTSNLVPKLFPFILPRLQQSVKLLDIYHNYGEIVELILSMFNAIIDTYLFHLDSDSSNKIYHTFLCLIEIFSKHNSRKRSYEANIEEDYFNDLLLFMTLLNTLSSKELIQELFEGTVTRSSVDANTISTVDVVLKGLEFLIPLMNQEMLKFQALCSEYFKLISYITDSNPDKIFSTSIELYTTLINSIDYGLNSASGSDIVRLCFECVISLCNFVFKNNLLTSEHAHFMQKLFNSVFYLIFRNPLENDLFEVASHSLFVLICCYQNCYKELVNSLLIEFSDDQLREKILSGFQALTPINLNLDKKNRLKFSEKFQKFCSETYGLLFIK